MVGAGLLESRGNLSIPVRIQVISVTLTCNTNFMVKICLRGHPFYFISVLRDSEGLTWILTRMRVYAVF